MVFEKKLEKKLGESVVSLNPRTKDGLKNVTSIGVMANVVTYFLIFIFPDFAIITQSMILGSIAISILLLVRVLLFASDPLETITNSWPPEPNFFQGQYPSKFLLKLCSTCHDKSRCQERPLNENSRKYIAIWYENFDSLKQRNPELWHRTYEKGFTCRLVFYMKYSFLFFLILGLLTLSGIFLLTALSSGTSQALGTITPLRSVYVASNLFLWIGVSLLNRPNMEHPTGCWAMWRDVSQQHVLRLEREIPELERLICDRHPHRERDSQRSVMIIREEAVKDNSTPHPQPLKKPRGRPRKK